MAARWLHHVTLTTGDARRSYADEVSAEALAVCRGLMPLLGGDPIQGVPIPATPYQLTGQTLTGRCLTVSIAEPQSSPVVTMAVAGHSKCGSRTWRQLHEYADEWDLPYVTDPERAPPEPWCAALLDTAAPRQPRELLMALGDLERCLAWAWLTR